MEPTDLATVSALANTDPSGVGSILLIIVLVIIPFIVKFWNWSKETSAQGMLYSQLSELVQNQRKELDEMYKQRKQMQDNIYELKSKVEHLEQADRTVEILKKKLDQKDQIIAERDARIAALLEELIRMKDRIHYLEMRLKADEEVFCQNCNKFSEFKSDKAITFVGDENTRDSYVQS